MRSGGCCRRTSHPGKRSAGGCAPSCDICCSGSSTIMALMIERDLWRGDPTSEIIGSQSIKVQLPGRVASTPGRKLSAASVTSRSIPMAGCSWPTRPSWPSLRTSMFWSRHRTAPVEVAAYNDRIYRIRIGVKAGIRIVRPGAGDGKREKHNSEDQASYTCRHRQSIRSPAVLASPALRLARRGSALTSSDQTQIRRLIFLHPL